MNESLDFIYFTLTRPSHALKRALHLRPLGLSFLIVLFASWSSYIGSLLSQETTSYSFSVSMLLMVKILTIFLFWFFLAGAIHFLAELLSPHPLREIKVSVLFIILGLSTFPLTFSAPLGLISELFSNWQGHFYNISHFILIFWVLSLATLGINQIYEFSKFRALICLILPGLMIAFTIFLILILIILTLMNLTFASLSDQMPAFMFHF